MAKQKIPEDGDPIVSLIDDRNISKSSVSIVCSQCKRLLDPIIRRCEAFEIIPDPIWDGKIKHKEPYAGDRGLRFIQMTPKDFQQQLLEAEAFSNSFKK